MTNLRNVIGFPTRHRKRKLESKLPYEIVTRAGDTETIELSPEDAPAIMILPVFKPLAYVTKEAYQGGIEMTGYFMNPSGTHTGTIVRNHDVTEIAVYSLRWPDAWGRMFAKIAYAFAVNEYGLDRFKKENVYVLNAILGKTNDVGKWVGCDGERVFGDEFDDQAAGLWIVENNEVHVIIKLFAWLNSVPEYHVRVGKLSQYIARNGHNKSTQP